jgi:hypothetical protein
MGFRQTNRMLHCPYITRMATTGNIAGGNERKDIGLVPYPFAYITVNIQIRLCHYHPPYYDDYTFKAQDHGQCNDHQPQNILKKTVHQGPQNFCAVYDPKQENGNKGQENAIGHLGKGDHLNGPYIKRKAKDPYEKDHHPNQSESETF